MRLRSFKGGSVPEAMASVRSTLGHEAIILSCIEDHEGVKITATLDQKSTPAVMRLRPLLETAAQGYLGGKQHVSETVGQCLTYHGVDSGTHEHILALVHQGAQIGGGDALSLLTDAFDEVFGFSGLDVAQIKTPLMLIGPPGVGKSVMIAKLAAAALLQGRFVEVITTDVLKTGAVDQMRAFGKAMNIPVHIAQSAENIQESLIRLAPASLALIDTPGINPFLRSDVEMIGHFILALRCSPFLVLPAGMDPNECADMCICFKGLGARSLILTKVDAARRLGSSLMAGKFLKFSRFNQNPHIAAATVPLTPQSLSSLFLKGFMSL